MSSPNDSFELSNVEFVSINVHHIALNDFDFLIFFEHKR